MKRLVLAVSVMAVTACAATTDPEPVISEPVMLSDEAFQELWNAAYKADPESDSEVAFTNLLERDDLTPTQRGRAYMGRGTMRGIFVRDWPEAFPQCALGDFMKAKDLPMSDASLTDLKAKMKYQLDRQQYFEDAPRLCLEYAAEAAVWLYAGDGKTE